MVKKAKNFTSEQSEMDFGQHSESPLETDLIPVLGHMDHEICGAVISCIAANYRSREQIIDRANMTLKGSDFKITIRKLNQWLAPSQTDKRIPAWALGPLIWAMNNPLVLQRIVHALGFELVDKREQQALHYAQAVMDEQRAKSRANELKKQMQIGR